MSRRIYLDHNASTPVHPEVVAAMLPYFGERFGNPSSVHSFGRDAREGLETAREQIAHILTSQIDHHAVLRAVEYLETLGFEASYVPVDAHGLVDPDDVRRALRPD